MFIWLVVLGPHGSWAWSPWASASSCCCRLLAAAFVIAGVLHVIGAVKAYNGEWWNPPFTPQFVK